MAAKLRLLDFQKECKTVLRDLERFDKMSGQDRKNIDEVMRMRRKAISNVAPEEASRLLKLAVEKYPKDVHVRDDVMLMLIECDLIIAQCKYSDDPKIVVPLDLLEERCMTTYGKCSFLYCAILSARREMLIRKSMWDEASDNAQITTSIYHDIFPDSFYHIKSLEAWAGSLGMARRFKEALPISELACKCVEKNDRYKYNDLGVTAYLQYGQIAMNESRDHDAEVALVKARRIIDALRDGAISLPLVEAVDKYHVICLRSQGKNAEAETIIEGHRNEVKKMAVALVKLSSANCYSALSFAGASGWCESTGGQ